MFFQEMLNVKNGIATDPKKIKTIQDGQPPKL